MVQRRSSCGGWVTAACAIIEVMEMTEVAVPPAASVIDDGVAMQDG